MKNKPAEKNAAHRQAPSIARHSTPWRIWLKLAAIVIVPVGLLFGLSLLWDYFMPSGDPEARRAAREARFKIPPKLNPNNPPGPAPEGMVWVPGGEFWMGAGENVEADNDSPHDLYGNAREVHKVYVDGFWMDTTEVTNAQFAKFALATGYKTVAEKDPDPKDFPDIPPTEKLKPFSLVFKKPERPVGLLWMNDAEQQWWDICFGASWRCPTGPDSASSSKGEYPVVHVCYDDAVAYCKWAGKRLPTEAEWEFAARGGLDRKIYCWGDDLLRDDKWLCNAWQGKFPNENTKEDGFEGIAPVAQYPANGYGLYDMAGNVWEWCHDFYRDDYYLDSPDKNPKGPASGFDPREPKASKHVQRGGSYLCSDNYCKRYLPCARGKGETSSGASHVGFRCVMDAK